MNNECQIQYSHFLQIKFFIFFDVLGEHWTIPNLKKIKEEYNDLLKQTSEKYRVY